MPSCSISAVSGQIDVYVQSLKYIQTAEQGSKHVAGEAEAADPNYTKIRRDAGLDAGRYQYLETKNESWMNVRAQSQMFTIHTEPKIHGLRAAGCARAMVHLLSRCLVVCVSPSCRHIWQFSLPMSDRMRVSILSSDLAVPFSLECWRFSVIPRFARSKTPTQD